MSERLNIAYVRVSFFSKRKKKNSFPGFHPVSRLKSATLKMYALKVESEKAEEAGRHLQLLWGKLPKARSRILWSLRTLVALKFDGT